MGWLWMCLGVTRDKSVRRIGGRVSSDTYLAPQYDPTKTPRIEDYLQPRGVGYDAKSSDVASDAEKDLAGGQKGLHPYRRCVSESIKGEYGPYWGYAEDRPAVEDSVSIEFPRVPRKSFSELLIETDTLDKGPLALAAMAAAAERAARSSRLQQEASSKAATGLEGSQIVTLKASKMSSTEPASEGEQHDSRPLSSLSKDHLEASNAVAAFRESRRRSQISSSSARPSYISSLFRSSRKRSLPTRSLSFQRPLSPVPEVLSLEEELRSGRKSDVVTSITKSPSSPPAPSSKPNQNPEEWDDYVMVDRAQETIPDAASSSVDAHVSSPSSEATSQDDATSSSPQQNHATSSSPQPDHATSSLPQQDHASSSLPQQDHASSSLPQQDHASSSLPQQDHASSSLPQQDHASSSLPQQDHASSSLPQQDHASSSLPQQNAILIPQRDASSLLPEWDASSFSHWDDASSSAARFERQYEDESLLRTPVRDALVTPEVFISPKTTSAELNFTRVMDMDPEERPIFGSLADHWEVAWATKRPAWDGKGIPNSTNKYREDQKVMWHAAPFEERLAQALASQQDPLPQRRNSFNGRTSRLAASRNDTSLQAH